MTHSSKATHFDIAGDVAKALALLAEPPDALIVGFSGGLDSTVLLAATAAFVANAGVQAPKLVACHVHHGILPMADQWLAHCRDSANELHVQFTAQRVGPPPAQLPDGLEGWARDQRQLVFEQIGQCFTRPVVLLAHHGDDQVETVLLNLARGAGPDGLGAMAAISQHGKLTKVRPLLKRRRSALLAWAEQRQLSWVDDPSNQDTHLRRNAVRLKIVPQFEAAFPGFVENVLRGVSANREMRELLAERMPPDAQHDSLARDRLREQSPAAQRYLLRSWLRHQGLRTPSQAKLAAMVDQLLNSDAAYAEIHHDGALIRRFRDQISVVSEASAQQGIGVASQASVSVAWHGESTLELPGFSGRLNILSAPVGQGIARAQILGQTMQLSYLRGRQRLRERADGPNRLIKSLCQERAISRWQRQALPMLSWQNEVVFAAGIGMNAVWQRLSAQARSGDDDGAERSDRVVFSYSQ